SGKLFEVNYALTINPPPVTAVVAGPTSFPYIDNAGGLFGALTGSGQVTINAVLGVDVNSQHQINFYIAPNSQILQGALTASTSSDGIGGSLSIGDLTVSATATGSVSFTGTLGLQATKADTDGRIRVSDLTSNLAQSVTGSLDGSVQLNVKFDA